MPLCAFDASLPAQCLHGDHTYVRMYVRQSPACFSHVRDQQNVRWNLPLSVPTTRPGGGAPVRDKPGMWRVRCDCGCTLSFSSKFLTSFSVLFSSSCIRASRLIAPTSFTPCCCSTCDICVCVSLQCCSVCSSAQHASLFLHTSAAAQVVRGGDDAGQARAIRFFHKRKQRMSVYANGTTSVCAV